jgi:hypothetical protein
VAGVGSRGTQSGPGKRGRVICVEGKQVTHEDSIMLSLQVPTQSEKLSGDHQPEPPSSWEPHTEIKYEVCDLCVVRGLGAVSENEMAEKPFVHEVQLLGLKGEIVRVCTVFNDGTMISAMSSQIYKKVRHRLQGWQPSKCMLCIANRALVKSQATWTGLVRLGGIQVQGMIEVFNSGGGWSFLFGKPMLQAFKANHDYEQDTIQVRDDQTTAELKNQINSKNYMKGVSRKASAVTDWKHFHKDPVLAVNNKGKQPEIEPEWSEVPMESPEEATTTFTRQQDLFAQKQVDTLLKAIEIEDDITAEQKEAVRSLIAKYTDCFALLVREVIPAKDTMLWLNISKEAQLLMKTHQCTFTPPQWKYLHKKILEMLEVGITKWADPSKIRCVSQMMLGQKQHDGAGLMLEELQHQVNKECEAAGLELHFKVGPPEEMANMMEMKNQVQKWRICQDFWEVNKHTKVAPMPQGNIHVKQHRLSGHQYISMIDFASGFYVVEIDQQSRPYTTFYIEGLGHFWYVRMLFRLTGAPTVFTMVTTVHLHNLITDEVLELFVDDGGVVANMFTEMMSKLEWILDQVHEQKLSL